MFKKSDILPSILALITTVLIVTLGFSWLAKNKLAGFGLLTKDSASQSGSNSLSNVNATAVTGVGANSKTDLNNINNDARARFSLPVIVPQGTSVAINGSPKLNLINRTLRKSFHQRYPGTVITTDGDGSTISLDLLSAREIDLAALDRPLSQAEKAAGLIAIEIYNPDTQRGTNSTMYYVYKEPLSPDAEAFLGYVFSKKGQQELESL